MGPAPRMAVRLAGGLTRGGISFHEARRIGTGYRVMPSVVIAYAGAGLRVGTRREMTMKA